MSTYSTKNKLIGVEGYGRFYGISKLPLGPPRQYVSPRSSCPRKLNYNAGNAESPQANLGDTLNVRRKRAPTNGDASDAEARSFIQRRRQHERNEGERGSERDDVRRCHVRI